MSTDHRKDPQAVSWEELTEEFDFTPAEKNEITHGAQAMIAASRAHRLAELRKRRHTTQVQVAEAMGVTQARVSRIERGQLARSEVDTLAAYVQALVLQCGFVIYPVGSLGRSRNRTGVLKPVS